MYKSSSVYHISGGFIKHTSQRIGVYDVLELFSLGMVFVFDVIIANYVEWFMQHLPQNIISV